MGINLTATRVVDVDNGTWASLIEFETTVLPIVFRHTTDCVFIVCQVFAEGELADIV